MDNNLVKEEIHMKHINHGKRLAHFKKRYKHIAAAFAGAILMSSALLPGLPVAQVHASANPNVGNTRDTSAKKIQNRNQEERIAGQAVKINQTPRNIAQSNVSRSEAINRIRQIFNANKTLRVASQLPATDNKADHLVTLISDKKYSPPNVSTSPVNEGKTDSLVTPSKDTKYTPPAAPSPAGESKVDTPSVQNPEKEYSPPPPAPPPPNEQKEEKPKQTNPEPEKTPVNPTPKSDTEEKQPSGAPTQYEKVLDITATAYAPGPLDNDQWGDKTYMGTTIRPGVIAVDPKVIPLGSRLYVEYPDGHGEYKVAEDTGGAIKGNRIDIAIMNRDKATDFGIKPVKVYVVETPKE
jgi:3D (Asp-Asp-Asp) domain-containing protein